MAVHARRVVQANGVDHIVKVIQGAVEEVELPQEDWDAGILVRQNGDLDEVNGDGKKNQKVVDIILSGEFLYMFGLKFICAYLCTLFLSHAPHTHDSNPLSNYRMDGILPPT